MACYHPIKAYQYGIGQKVVFLPKEDTVSSSEYKRLVDEWQYTYDSQTEYPRALLIPCQQCLGCRITYTRNWAIRCLLESKLHPEHSCWFVTLTYDNDHLPRSFACDIDTGEVRYETFGTLVPYDLKKFMKDFREYMRYHYNLSGIRFFGCGEYGTLSKRPHYHLIIFGLPYSDDFFQPFKYQKKGNLLLDCLPISKVWKKGMCPVGELTYDSASYVAGYMLKKLKGKQSDEYYLSNGIVKEFSRMSNRPGIAGEYFDMYSDSIYESDSLGLCLKGNFSPKPPKYFDNLYKANHLDDFYKISAVRPIKAKEARSILLENIGMIEEEYLSLCENNLKSSCKSRMKKIN